MTQDVRIFITQTERGFLAATRESPFFCLEAKTEPELLDLVKDALKFFASRPITTVTSVTRTTAVTTFRPSRIVNSSELAVA